MWMPSERSRDHFNSVLCLTQDYKNRVTAMCPRVLRLSVNIKDTAGCCVFRKQVSLHKQLYNKSCPSPLLMCLPACLFHFMGRQCYSPAAFNGCECLLRTRQHRATGTMTQLWRSFTRHGLIFHATSGVSWHISGCEWIHGKKKSKRFLFNNLRSVFRTWCHQSDVFRTASVVMINIMSIIPHKTVEHLEQHAEHLFAHRIFPPDPPHVWRLCALPAGVSALSGESQRPDEGHERGGQHRWGGLFTFPFDLTLDFGRDISACALLTPSAEREEDFTLTETTPTSPDPESYSPTRSVHSVGVSSASSPIEAVSPEYTGGASTTGDSNRDVLNKQMSHYTSFLCANTFLFCP